jgi:hypothetical protein
VVTELIETRKKKKHKKTKAAVVDWQRVAAEHFPSGKHGAAECRNRYEVLGNGSVRFFPVPWTKEEDQKVKELVRTNGKSRVVMMVFMSKADRSHSTYLFSLTG